MGCPYAIHTQSRNSARLRSPRVREKAPFPGPFGGADDGTRTHDLLHGKLARSASERERALVQAVCAGATEAEASLRNLHPYAIHTQSHFPRRFFSACTTQTGRNESTTGEVRCL